MARTYKFYDTPEFRQLNSAWKRKLKEAGFEDIEDSENPEEPLPQRVRARAWKNKGVKEASNYYDSAVHYLISGVFDSKHQKAIWALHSYGHSLRGIASKLGLSKTAVGYHVQKVKNRMFNGEQQG